MKKIIFASMLLFAVAANAQEAHPKEKVQAEKGVVYGKVSEEKTVVAVDELKNKLVDNKFEGQVKGKVVEVCQSQGCWIKIQKADGTSMTVKSNQAFLMPANIVGKMVLVEGTAVAKETTDAQKDVQFAAKGVKVLE